MLHLPLAKQVLDRSAELRSDQSALDRLLPGGVFYHFSAGSWLIDGDLIASLDFNESQKIAGSSERYFLGIDAEGRGHFLYHHLEPLEDLKELEGSSSRFTIESLRSKVALFSPLHVGVSMHGQGLANWHATHRFCSRCGEETHPILGGAVRSCSQGHHHHPRTDPAIITLIKDRSDRILLGHQATWPEGRFSTIAGFVETGESFEGALHREVGEEAGVTVDEFRYLGSQPWPFPSSVMIAFEAVTYQPEIARPDGEEITEIRWFDRAALLDATRTGEILLPPPISVARAMIDRWYEEVPGQSLTTKDAWRS
jgi:NAD+ diphosphatase